MAEDNEWTEARDSLVRMVTDLGFPEDLGHHMARMLGSPKAIRRMTKYLEYERPKDIETAVDEMLAIYGEIDSWKDKKDSEEANTAYNEVLRYGLDGRRDLTIRRCGPRSPIRIPRRCARPRPTHLP